YFNAIAGAVDLAHYRLAGGDWDEAKERKFLELCDLAHFKMPVYRKAGSVGEKLAAVEKVVSHLIEGVGIEIPEFHAATPTPDRAAALMRYMNQHEGYLLKPMNCPHHIQIYKAEPRSYRDLPVRLAEFGTVYRFEQTGELSGMTRVRGFTQDDAHLFCTAEQVGAEFGGCIEFTQFFLNTLGLSQYRVRLGFRDPASDKYVGSEQAWNQAQEAIQQVAQSMGLPDLQIEPGEAAFYGPKVDFIVKDCIGREWQLGTVQLDYN